MSCEIVLRRQFPRGSGGRVESGRDFVLSADGRSAVQHRERERRAVLGIQTERIRGDRGGIGGSARQSAGGGAAATRFCGGSDGANHVRRAAELRVCTLNEDCIVAVFCAELFWIELFCTELFEREGGCGWSFLFAATDIVSCCTLESVCLKRKWGEGEREGESFECGDENEQ